MKLWQSRQYETVERLKKKNNNNQVISFTKEQRPYDGTKIISLTNRAGTNEYLLAKKKEKKSESRHKSHTFHEH